MVELKTENPTILIEPETEEDLTSEVEDIDIKVDTLKRPDKNVKDKGKLSERSGSREYFRRSFERRGKKSSRYRASQKKREFDIERYGERLIRALEDCLRKGELSKEVSEDTKERDIDNSSKLSSQFSKSEEQTHYEVDSEYCTEESQTLLQPLPASKSLNLLSEEEPCENISLDNEIHQDKTEIIEEIKTTQQPRSNTSSLEHSIECDSHEETISISRVGENVSNESLDKSHDCGEVTTEGKHDADVLRDSGEQSDEEEIIKYDSKSNRDDNISLKCDQKCTNGKKKKFNSETLG